MVQLHDNIPKYVAVSARQIQAFMARRMESLGIGPGQYTYLFALYREDGQTQQSLADHLLVDKSAAVGAINRLEGLGYVERRSDPEDRRTFRIHLTERGRAIRPELEACVEEVQEILLQGLSPEERGLLGQLLKRVLANVTRANR
ncbi:MAG: MarR family winged helix-turn-helix transcriptional regulator [Bacillota bacterium]